MASWLLKVIRGGGAVPAESAFVRQTIRWVTSLVMLLGIFTLVSGALGLAFAGVIPEGDQAWVVEPGDTLPWVLLGTAYRHATACAVVQCTLSTGLLACAIGLWYCREWARKAVLGFSLVALALVLIGALWFGLAWATEVGRLSENLRFLRRIQVFGAGVCVMAAILWGTPLVLLIRFLRSPAVRAVTQPHGTAGK